MKQLYKDNRKFILLEIALFVILFSHYNNQIPNESNIIIFIVASLISVLLIVLFGFSLRRCNDSINQDLKKLMLIFTFFAAPMFWTHNNFGVIDIYGLVLVLFGVLLLISSKFEWLLIPIVFIASAIDVEIVFLYINVILILLLYKVFCSKDYLQKKYIVILISCLFTICAVLINYVITGQLLQKFMGENSNWNLWQLPIFFLVMLPYCLIIIGLFIRMIRNTKINKLLYILLFTGALTIIPTLFMQQNYGRWMFALIFYYSIILLALASMHDRVFEIEIINITNKLSSIPGIVLLLGYPIIFQPLEWIATGVLFENIVNII